MRNSEADSWAKQKPGWKRLKRNPTQPEKEVFEVFEVFAGKSSLRGTYSRRALPAGDARQRAFRRDLCSEKTNHLDPSFRPRAPPAGRWRLQQRSSRIFQTWPG